MKTKNSIHSTKDFIIYAQPYIKGKVLDAGGGRAGKYRSLILVTAKEYVCLDLQGGGLVNVVGDVLAMPIADSSFDTIVCNQVLEHVNYPARLISEAFRVVKSGGYFLCTAPFLEPSHSDPSDFFRYTPDGLRSLCADAGFDVRETQSYGGVWMVLFSFLKFNFFDPYQPSTKNSRRLLRYLEKFFTFLDRFIRPGRIYSDCYVIAQKP